VPDLGIIHPDATVPEFSSPQGNPHILQVHEKSIGQVLAGGRKERAQQLGSDDHCRPTDSDYLLKVVLGKEGAQFIPEKLLDENLTA
jgi:hypothetical protein